MEGAKKMNETPDIFFPHIGVKISHLDPIAFTIGPVSVYWYGLLIGIGVISGLIVAMTRAKKSGQNPETYQDFLLYALIFALIGARLYYVLFSWDKYQDNLIKIFALREGGLAIYGGVIGAVLTALIYTKRKKISFWLLADTAAPGLILGQAIGRWGNFVNREAFGGYTDNLFAMALRKDQVYDIHPSILLHEKIVNGITYIQVHPTFLYESLWNLSVFIFLLIYTKYKKFTGEVFVFYILGYALGRVWIEGLRTDQLLIPNTQIPISQLLAGILIIASITYIIIKRKKN